MASLERALALAPEDAAAFAVAEDLDLDVAGRLEKALDEHRAVGERRARLLGGARDRRLQVFRVGHEAHALAAAAARGLDQVGWRDPARGQRRRPFGGGKPRQLRRGQRRQRRHAQLGGQRARGLLAAERAHALRSRAHETDAGSLDRRGEAPDSRRGTRSPGGAARRPNGVPPPTIPSPSRNDATSSTSSASRRTSARASAGVDTTATFMRLSRAERRMRLAISPRLAMTRRLTILFAPGRATRARSAPRGTPRSRRAPPRRLALRRSSRR